MNAQTTADASAPVARYRAPARFLHWIMAIGMIVAWILGVIGANNGPGPIRSGVLEVHKSIATVLLVLVALRIAWRLVVSPPEHHGTPVTVAIIKLGHGLLYALMIALPISGWVWSSSAGKHIPFAGIVNLPPLVPQNVDWIPIYGAVHFWLGWLTGAVVLGHIGFALKHHFIDKDNALRSML